MAFCRRTSQSPKDFSAELAEVFGKAARALGKAPPAAKADASELRVLAVFFDKHGERRRDFKEAVMDMQVEVFTHPVLDVCRVQNHRSKVGHLVANGFLFTRSGLATKAGK